VRENKLFNSSASDMMAVKHNMKSANTKNAVKVAAPNYSYVQYIPATLQFEVRDKHEITMVSG
jgi:hypothetical protein